MSFKTLVKSSPSEQKDLMRSITGKMNGLAKGVGSRVISGLLKDFIRLFNDNTEDIANMIHEIVSTDIENALDAEKLETIMEVLEGYAGFCENDLVNAMDNIDNITTMQDLKTNLEQWNIRFQEDMIPHLEDCEGQDLSYASALTSQLNNYRYLDFTSVQINSLDSNTPADPAYLETVHTRATVATADFEERRDRMKAERAKMLEDDYDSEYVGTPAYAYRTRWTICDMITGENITKPETQIIFDVFGMDDQDREKIEELRQEHSDDLATMTAFVNQEAQDVYDMMTDIVESFRSLETIETIAPEE
ncbi:hypothetical protein [Candidatus Entotheonella palauensis]|uniref:hypothetical protein n=1 Tax=Candidatus Entotheonella palauensis TaxID=93172 RepID=UPI0011778668|nr:hypothetical protein [Candidatus Entotheonella palauensis]